MGIKKVTNKESMCVSWCHHVLNTYVFPIWWRHQMETFSAWLVICAGNSPVSGEFPVHRPVTRSFDVFFDLRLNKRLSKQSWGWRFETLSSPLGRQCNDFIHYSTLMWHRLFKLSRTIKTARLHWVVILSMCGPCHWYLIIIKLYEANKSNI